MAGSISASTSGSVSASRSATPSGHRRSAHIPSGLHTPSRTNSSHAAASHQSARPKLQPHGMHLVLSEISAVTSVIRKSTRWTASSSAALNSVTSYSYSSASLAPTSNTAAHPPSASSSGPNVRPSMGLRQLNKSKDADASASARLGFSFTAAAKTEDPVGLLSGFSVLRSQLRACSDFASFPLPTLLSPFLRVILSARTSAPITSAALQAVHKFLVCGLIHTGARGAQLAIAEIAHATSHCRFEASEATTDELVLVRILAVMRDLICDSIDISSIANHDIEDGMYPRPHGLADSLGDDSICEMMETGLSMCCQTRLSEVLRRTAEQSVTAMLRTLFGRLSSIPTTVDEFFSSRPGVPDQEPEHATLAAEPVGDDAELDEKRLRRMTMPDPTSNAFPAAAVQALKELKEIGEEEDQEESSKELPTKENASKEESAASSNGDKEKNADADVSTTEHENVTLPKAEEEEPTDMEADIQQTTAYAPLDVEPYGLPAIREVFRVVISLLDPANLQHTDTMRRLGISMLISIFETAGKSIGRFPSLRALVQDSACKYLFILAKNESTLMLSLSLRCISALFETMRGYLKLQHEHFVSFLLDRLAPTFSLPLEPWSERAFDSVAKRALASESIGRAGTPDSSAPAPPSAPPASKTSDRAPATGEARELFLETLSLLFRTFDADRPSEYLVDLYVNYDCDIDCENMYERVVSFLCRSIHAAHPQHPTHQDNLQLFALDALLSFISALADRQDQLSGPVSVTLPGNLSFDTLSLQKGKKAAILAGAARFNAKPKDGLAYLEQEGLLDYGDSSLPREQRVAKFLKDCPRLDKKLLGDYLGRPDHVKALAAFIGLFDFEQKPIADALREMLESFRLPGESQQIERITQTFATTYFAAQPEGIATEDAVFILAYSVIMLNTDLHNPQNKRRMTVEDYRKNLRGVNDGHDFDPELTGAIYESIRKREIVMPEEHIGQLGFEYAWKEVLRRSRTAGGLLACDTAAFDRKMFETGWKPIFSSVAFAFSTFRDEYMVERAISGIRQCGILASDFDMIEVLDFMVHTLASATGLLDSSVSQTLTSNPTVEVENQRITVSPLSTRFGVNFKGQLAAVVLFTIANGNVDAIRTGWADLFEIFKNLFAHGMLPLPMVQMEDLSDGKVPIPLKPKKIPGPSPQDPRAQGGGLFSTLSSYLLSPYSSSSEPVPYEASPQDVEATLSSVDCITSCRIEDLWDQIQHLGTESHLCAVHYLRFQIESLTVEKVLFRESGNWTGDGTSTPNSSANAGNSSSAHLGPNGTSSAGGLPLPYDPRVSFLLELLTVIVTSSPSVLVSETWPWLSEHICAVLRNAKAYHQMTVEREVAALLRIIDVVAADEGLQPLPDQVFLALDLLRTLPVEIRISGSKQLLAGLHRILATKPHFVRSQTEWSLVFALIADNSNMRNADSARLAFEVTKAALVGPDAQLSRDASATADHSDSLSRPLRLTPDNFDAAVAQLVEFANGADTTVWRNAVLRETTAQRRTTLTEKKEVAEAEKVQQERGIEAVVLLEMLKSEIPRLVDIQRNSSAAPGSIDDAWSRFWLVLLGGLSKQWINAYAPVRSTALPLLQRALFSTELAPSSPESKALVSSSALIRVVFVSTLFPLMEDLSKPQVYQLDPPSAANKNGGMLEVRIRASALICKTFLHLMPHLAPQAGATDTSAADEFKKLWLDILDFMDRMINSTGGNAGRRNPLTEAIPENLKNVLLVMSTSHLLSPPTQTQSQSQTGSTFEEDLFNATTHRLQSFLPGLVLEVFGSTPAAAPVHADAPPDERTAAQPHNPTDTTAQ